MARRMLPQERLVLAPIRKHWIILVRPFVIPAVIALVLVLLVDGLGAGATDGSVRTVVTLLIAGGAALWALFAWLVRRTSSLTLTNQRVIQEEGFLVRRSNVIPLDRIQDISIRQSITGRLLEFGDIEIDTAGVVANEVFTYVPRPESVRDQLFMLSRSRQRSAAGV
jgi:uncharacterized membrane protein YdbT with pleckstrin-like domain